MIATTSDVVQTAIRTYAGDENAIKNFDLGGFLVTVYRLITDTKYILKIKEEFIFNEWDKIVEAFLHMLNLICKSLLAPLLDVLSDSATETSNILLNLLDCSCSFIIFELRTQNNT